MNFYKKCITISFVVSLFSPELIAQQKIITVIVKDTADHPMEGASVSLLDNNNLVINYGFADKKGYVELALSQNGYLLSVSYVGYKKLKQKLEPGKYAYNIRLHPELKSLEDVEVKTRSPTELHGDTLKYIVKSFAAAEDRTIEDVLKRLPGIEIDKNGYIYFNGKKIENLYIEGDDLMDGRYSMATKVIKKELIESVDIINHYQPVKVLKDKVFTNNIALNLVLQNENELKLSAASRLGFGIPAQTEVSIAPILLNKRIKTLNRIAYNNAGIDYRGEMKQLGNPNFISNMTIDKKDVDLSAGNIAMPDVPMNYYYQNSSAIFNLNTLYKTKNEIQFKLNGNLYADRNKLTYENEIINFLLNDTINYSGRQAITAKPLLLNGSFNVMINRTNYFLNNSLKVDVNNEKFSALTAFNGNEFLQGLAKNTLELANDFNWIPAIKKKGVFEVRWYAAYGTNKQHLDIGNGYYFDIVPQRGYYDKVIQQLRSPSFFNNAYVAYKIPAQKVYQEYKLGYTSLRQKLNSRLNLIDDGLVLPYANDKGNDITLQSSSVYFLCHYQLKFQNFRSDINLPLSLQKLQTEQPYYTLSRQKKRLLFLPNLNFTYNFNNEQYIQASYSLQNTFGDITNSYNGAILLDYKRLQSYNEEFPQQKMHNADLSYFYQKSIKLFYSNIGLSYNYLDNNMVLSDSFSNNIVRTVFLSYPNHQTSLNLHAGISKYLISLKTKVGLNAQKQWVLNMQFVNGELLHFRNNNFSFHFSADKKIRKIFDIDYHALFSWLQTKPSDKINDQQFSSNSLFYFDQKLRLSFGAFKNFYIETTGIHRINKQSGLNKTGFFFMDADIKRLKLFRGVDVELNCYNLFNIKNYRISFQNQNQVLTNRFQLRGRCFFFRFNYSF